MTLTIPAWVLWGLVALAVTLIIAFAVLGVVFWWNFLRGDRRWWV